MRDKIVKKRQIDVDVNAYSNRLGEVVGEYQEALVRKAQELEKNLQAPAANKEKPSL